MLDAGKKYNATLFGLLLVVLATAGSYVYSADPYWLFSADPVWVRENRGHNHVLDVNMRFAKSLEVVARQPRAIVIGSSRVYRGMSTEEIRDGSVYNLGISSLRITEVHAFLSHALRWTDVDRVAIGLDDFMFDSHRPYEAGFDPTLADFHYLFKAVPASMLTLMAVRDATTVLNGDGTVDGAWTYHGYKHSYVRLPSDAARVLGTFYNSPMTATEREYDELRAIIALARGRDIALHLFISPLNQSMVARMKERGLYTNFVAWKEQVAAIARESDITLYDLSESNPYHRDSVENGSTEHWIDPSHYSPVVGRWILQRIGFGA